VKVGDLVRLKPPKDATMKHPMRKWPWADEVGIIVDLIEDETGFYDYQVVFSHGPEWVKDLLLELVCEA